MNYFPDIEEKIDGCLREPPESAMSLLMSQYKAYSDGEQKEAFFLSVVHRLLVAHHRRVSLSRQKMMTVKIAPDTHSLTNFIERFSDEVRQCDASFQKLVQSLFSVPDLRKEWLTVKANTGTTTASELRVTFYPSDRFNRLFAAVLARDREFLIVEYGHFFPRDRL